MGPVAVGEGRSYKLIEIFINFSPFVFGLILNKCSTMAWSRESFYPLYDFYWAVVGTRGELLSYAKNFENCVIKSSFLFEIWFFRLEIFMKLLIRILMSESKYSPHNHPCSDPREVSFLGWFLDVFLSYQGLLNSGWRRRRDSRVERENFLIYPPINCLHG